MRIDAVILDMDGLMLDTESMYKHAWQTASAALGHEIDDEWYMTIVGLPNTVCEQKLLAHFGPSYPMEEFRTRWTEVWQRSVTEAGIPPKAGLYELLDFLEVRRLPIAVATSSVREYAELSLKRAAVHGRFTIIVTGDQVAHHKPAPDIYVRAAKLLGVAPSRCIALEDSDVGVLAASRAGIRTLMIPDIKPPSEDAIAAAYGVLGSLHEARELIATLL